MRKQSIHALSMVFLALLSVSHKPAQANPNAYSCEAFGRMSGASLPRNLPCVDMWDDKYYKSFNLFCEAKSLQSDIRMLQGCDRKYFLKQEALYGR